MATRKKLIEDLDEVFSKWVRLSAADKNGYCSCFTCGRKKHWKKQQAGHFITRGAMSTRWLPMNVKVQCVKCNIFQQGRQYEFARNLDQQYGQGTADRIRARSKKAARLTNADLEAYVNYYKDQVKILLND